MGSQQRCPYRTVTVGGVLCEHGCSVLLDEGGVLRGPVSPIMETNAHLDLIVWPSLEIVSSVLYTKRLDESHVGRLF